MCVSLDLFALFLANNSIISVVTVQSAIFGAALVKITGKGKM